MVEKFSGEGKKGFQIKDRLTKQTIVFFIVFIILSILPLLFTHIGKEVMYRGDDLYFHLNRIEGLTLGIKNSDFFPKINYFFLYDMGYASPLFYSDIFLYPAALFRIAGLSISNSYILFLFFINLLTYVIAYFSFLYYKSIQYQAVVFAVLYGSAAYRLSDLTERAAVGELIALAFIPLAFIGLWSIVNKGDRRFYLLSIGMAGLILSHVLSAFLFSLFIVLYVLVHFRSFITSQVKGSDFLKAVFLTVLLCAGFLLPLGEQLMDQSFNFQKAPITQLSQHAASLMDYLQIAFRNSGFNNLGLLMFVLILSLVVTYHKLSTQARKLVVIMVILLVASTNVFPHTFFEKTLVNSIQFPWRLFSLVTFCACWLFADNYSKIVHGEKRKRLIVCGVLISTVVLVLAHGRFVSDKERLVAREEIERLQPAFLGWGNEYLPASIDIYELIQEPKMLRNSKGISFENVTFRYGGVNLEYDIPLENTKETVIFPFIYYKGYQAKVNDQRIEVYNSPNFPGLSELRLNGKGTIDFFYRWTKIQIYSMCISVSTWLFLFGSIYKKGRTKKVRE